MAGKGMGGKGREGMEGTERKGQEREGTCKVRKGKLDLKQMKD